MDLETQPYFNFLKERDWLGNVVLQSTTLEIIKYTNRFNFRTH